MYHITFKGKTFDCNGEQAVLDCALSQKVFMPYSCKEGECMACMVRVMDGQVPAEAQLGLSDAQIGQNLMLACQCKPLGDMVLEPVNYTPPYTAIVQDKTWLNPSVVRLRLQRPEGFDYNAGQYVHIQHPESKVLRSYSLASLPEENCLELHVRHIEGGLLSGWLCQQVEVGDSLAFSQAFGSCVYQSGQGEQALILAGVGTGLAPLYGILRDALKAGHQGKIYVFHGSFDAAGLYYRDELLALCESHAQITYMPCVLHGDAPEGGKQGEIDQIILQTVQDLADKRAYLCGDDAVVQRMKTSLTQAGMSPAHILADAFVPSH